MDKKTNVNEKIKQIFERIEPGNYPICAFILTFLVYTLTLSFMGKLSNGIYLITQGDLHTQIIPFIFNMRDVILGKHSLWYSWNLGLGGGSIGTYAYYTLSPFNIAYLILGKNHIQEATYLIIVLKAATSAATFQLFLNKYLKRVYFETIIISMLYALNGYVICYYHAVLNMDAVLIFPIIMLGIIKLFRTGKTGTLLFGYIYAIGVQLYMGYIAGMSSFIIFMFILGYKMDTYDIKEIAGKVIRFVLSVFGALGITCFIWLPALMNIFEFNNFYELYSEKIRCNIITLINNLFSGQFQSVDGFVPYIYCGIITVLILPMFFMNKRINKRKRIFFGLCLMFWIGCIFIDPLNYFMHGFDMPNKVGYRYSFVICFILLVILSEQFIYVRSSYVDKPFYIGTIIVLYSIVFWISSLLFKSQIDLEIDLRRVLLYVINLLIISGWFYTLYLYKRKKMDLFTKRAVFMMLASFEMCVNIYFCNISMGNITQAVYDYYMKASENTANIIKNDPEVTESFRTIYTNEYMYNLGVLHDMNSVSIFSSILNEKNIECLENLGFSYAANYIYGQGWTPVTASLLGIDYIIDGSDILSDSPDVPVLLMPSEHYYQNNAKNSRTLPIAFYADKKILDYHSGESVFENQELLLSGIMGRDVDCYKKIDSEVVFNGTNKEQHDDSIEIINLNYPEKEASVTFKGKVNGGNKAYMNLYNDVHVDTNTKSIPIVAKNGSFMSDTYAPTLYPNQIVNVGTDSENNVEVSLIIPAEVDKVSFKKDYFMEYIADEFAGVYDELSSKGLKVEVFKDGYVTGNINCADDGFLFTSIPYEKGWKAYIDGIETGITPVVEDAFVSVAMEKGFHEIKLVYEAPGRKMGKWISISCIIIFIAFSLISGKASSDPEKERNDNVE